MPFKMSTSNLSSNLPSNKPSSNEPSSNERSSDNWSHLIFRSIKKMQHSGPVFYGFTHNHIIRSNDPYEGRQIFFNNYSFDSSSSSFPSVNDLICGIVEETIKGPKYKYWFVCPYDFLYLWTLALAPKHPALYQGRQLKSIEQILSEMEEPYREAAKKMLNL